MSCLLSGLELTRRNDSELFKDLVYLHALLEQKETKLDFLLGERVVIWINPQREVSHFDEREYLSLNDLATHVLRISYDPDRLALTQRAAGIKIVTKALSLYQQADEELPRQNLITRILVAIRERIGLFFLFPAVDYTRLRLKADAEDKLASLKRESFCQLFDPPQEQRLEEHRAFAGTTSGADGTRIIVKREAFLNKAEELQKTVDERLRCADPNDSYVKKIRLSPLFERDPTSFMINEIMNQDVDQCMMNEVTRARIIRDIPNFIDQATSFEYLEEIAKPNFELLALATLPKYSKEDYLRSFRASFDSPTCKKQLQKAQDHAAKGEWLYAVKALRKAYLIFDCAENLELLTPKTVHA
ncbi:MAG: hypothetical protein Q8L98_08130 [Chlamydiales bacterium]|nr:hypothetical protein [Chlamydiales bacterium]